ncbi:unnamed protein product [Amoebophrya sp. A25]|nr:unnamed protein product [Amoebophrya sp. A25]|eukprot:GSA25T00023630001.1
MIKKMFSSSEAEGQHGAGPPSVAARTTTGVNWRRCLVWFAHHNLYYNMRFQELEALADMCGISKTDLYRDPATGFSEPPSAQREEPFVYINLPEARREEVVRFWLSRAVMIKYVVDVWGEGTLESAQASLSCAEKPEAGSDSWTSICSATAAYTDLQAKLKSDDWAALRRAAALEYVNSDKTFCFRCFAFGKSLHQEYKQRRITEVADFLWGPISPAEAGQADEGDKNTPSDEDRHSPKRHRTDAPLANGATPSTASSSRVAAEPQTACPTSSSASNGAPANSKAAAEAHSTKRPTDSSGLPQKDSSKNDFYLHRPRKIDLQGPETMLMILEDYGVEETHKLDKTLRRVFLARHLGSGRTHMASSKNLAFYEHYALNKRCILGPTTMENELAFLMANCGQVSSSSLAMDPFCGTGGLLIPMAHFDTQTIGSDLDIRVLKGWRIAYQKNTKKCAEICESIRFRKPEEKTAAIMQTGSTSATDAADVYMDDAAEQSDQNQNARDITRKSEKEDCIIQTDSKPQDETKAAAKNVSGEHSSSSSTAFALPAKKGPASHPSSSACKDIYMNFYQYKLKRPEIVVTDNSRKPWRQTRPWLDAIVTDPPYGIRAASKKVQNNFNGGDDPRIYDRGNYIARKELYEEDEILRDLLRFAARNLVDGGRLVFLLPIDLVELKRRAAAEDGSLVQQVGAGGELPQTVDSIRSLRERALPQLPQNLSSGVNGDASSLTNTRRTGNSTAMTSASAGGEGCAALSHETTDVVAAEGTGASAGPPPSSANGKPLANKKTGRKQKQKNQDWWTNTTRDPVLLDQSRYAIPTEPGLELESATLQVLSGGLGRLLVVMNRLPRVSQDSRIHV